ncbi:LCP family protein [Streptomyces viridosporus]|uniref:LytR family transcriptional regulator n=2 Tax=Streptomyces viridosporus TaxID=67581 RepID=A0ABX6AQI7_STRVD|nr:LCP family protein [Streptomyces viridosporus]QEU89273.1 LytR family transcriptional regulator [Streptomyces viridosporus T7A]
MSDTAGAPSGQPGGRRALGPGTGASASGPGRARRRRRRWALGTGLTVTAALVVAAGVGWVVYLKLDGNITPDEAAAAELARFEEERPTALVKDALNILLIGSDSRSGAENRRYGRDVGTERSDTVILLHLPAGRRSATAVSVPRDLMVDVPGCLHRDGSRTEPEFAAFNTAFERGGSACAIRTVEKLTDIRVDHHVVVDFHGFTKMVDAVDGVEVCLREPVDDEAAGLRLPAGRVTLDGEQALGYVRARKSLGDGSDTERMERQQRFLGALVSKVRSNGVLLNPVKLYPLLDAATSSLTTDPELANLRGLYELVRGLRNIPTERVQFLTVPREPYVRDANRDQLAEPAAEKLFDRLRRDAPVTVAQSGERGSATESGGGTPHAKADGEGTDSNGKTTEKDGSEPSGDTSPTPTFSGNTAAEDTCG